MTEPKMMEFRLPAPPGQWRVKKFNQLFKNETPFPTALVDMNVTLQPSEIVEIEWTPENNNAEGGTWKVTRLS